MSCSQAWTGSVCAGGSARLRVDFIACDGRGLCAAALPELITLDDWGFPLVSDRDVPARRLGNARATVRACPLLALRLDAGTSHHARSASLVPGRPAWYG
jgi:ferredoxin